MPFIALPNNPCGHKIPVLAIAYPRALFETG